jgi:DNA-binding MarR family transcriptional regulator
MADPTLDAPPENLIDALAQTAFLITAVLNREAAEHDLSLTQLRVLAILRDRRLRMSALAEFLGLEKSTMSGLVDRASARGLLTRAPSTTDKRAVDVFLTEAGSALAERLFARVGASLLPLVDTLAPADQRRLHELLAALLAR